MHLVYDFNTMTLPTHHTFVCMDGASWVTWTQPITGYYWLPFYSTTFLLIHWMMCVQKCLKNCSFQSGQMEGASGFDRDYSNAWHCMEKTWIPNTVSLYTWYPHSLHQAATSHANRTTAPVAMGNGWLYSDFIMYNHPDHCITVHLCVLLEQRVLY